MFILLNVAFSMKGISSVSKIVLRMGIKFEISLVLMKSASLFAHPLAYFAEERASVRHGIKIKYKLVELLMIELLMNDN